MKRILGFLLLMAAGVSWGQTPNFQITSGYYPTSGTGIGFYTANYYSSIYDNNVWGMFDGSFQPVQYGSAENGIAGSATVFGSQNAFDPLPQNFYAGYNYTIAGNGSATTANVSGHATGSGTIASNTLGLYGASGNVTSGSNVITSVSGVGAGPGAFASIIAANGSTGAQYLPSNTYVTAYNAGAATITLSANANTTQTGALIAFGPTFTTSSSFTNAAQFNDVMLVHSPTTPTPTTFCPGWAASGSGTATVDTTDVPASPVVGLPAPVQTCKITLAAGQTLTLSNSLDSVTSGPRYYYFQGIYNAGFKAILLTGGMTVAPFINRPSQSPYFTNTVALSGSGFNPYTVASSSINETSASFSGCTPNCTVSTGLTFTNTGSGTATAAFIALRMDRATHTTGGSWDDRVIGQLQAGKWQEHRFNPLGCSSALPVRQSLLPEGYRPPSSGSQISGNDPYGPTQICVGLGLDDFVKNAVASGATKIEWDIPVTSTAQDLQDLTDYFGGGTGTVGGAARIALGTTTPWTSTLQKINIAYGNELWNLSQPGMAIAPGQNGVNAIPMSANVALALKSSATWVPAIEKTSANVQQSAGSANAGYITAATNGSNIDTQTSSDYNGPNGITNCAPTVLYQSSLVDAYAQSHDSSNTINQTLSTSVPTVQYEAAIGATSGNCTVAQLAGFDEGQGQGQNDVYLPASLQRAFPGKSMDFNRWELNGLNRGFSSSASSTPATVIAGWGDWSGSQVGIARPTVPMQAMYNALASLGTGRTITQTNVPTFNWTAANGIATENNVPLVDGFAYCPGTGASCTGNARGFLMFNNDAAASHAFTVSGLDVPSGSTTVTKTLFCSTNVTDNNDTTANTVVTVASTQTGFAGDTLPAHCSATYQWTAGSSGTIYQLL